MDSDAHYLAALLRVGAPAGLREVDPTHLEPAWRAVYGFCQDFVRRSGTLPRPETVEGHFGRPLPAAPEEPAYYAGLIRQNAKRAAMEEGLAELVGQPLQQADPDAALAGMRAVQTKIASDFRAPERGLVLDDMAANVPARRTAYGLRTRLKGQQGLPTPWPTLTRATGGYLPGEVWAVVARPGGGKSWAMCLSAVHLWQLGFRVLFVSMETPPHGALPRDPRHRVVGGACVRCGQAGVAAEQPCEAAVTPQQRLSIRFDAIGARVSAWRLQQGCLTPREQQQVDHYWHLCESRAGGSWGHLRVTCAPVIRTLADLEAEIHDYRPDIVFWDSAYLAAPQNVDAAWGQRRNPAGELIVETKHVAERAGLPIVLSWHFNRDVDERAADASQNAAALTDEVGRVLDVLVGLFRPPELASVGEAILRTLKVRDGTRVPELRVRFSVRESLDFGEIASGPPGGRPEEGR